MNVPKFVFAFGAAPTSVRTCRTRDMPIGIIIAMVAASDTNIETMPTISMYINVSR